MPSSATVTDQADVFAALLDHLRLERVVMCGFSAGGPPAIRTALRYPDRLAGLILGSSYFLAIRGALFPVRPKKLGIAFDALVSEPASDAFPLEDILAPTLVVHAADDRLAPYEHVEPAAERIPSSRLVTIEAGGHLFLRHAAEAREATTVFISEVLVGAGGGAER
jgi:pimeloyl-ACP methyl ester carboxylesterase